MNEMELLKTSRGTPQSSPKGSKGRGKSISESELVLDIMEQITPILIKAMTTGMDAVMKSVVTSEQSKIVKLEVMIDSLEMEADKRERYSRRPILRFQDIPEKSDEVTNQLIIETISQTMGLTNIGENQLERSHRVGPKENNQGKPRERRIIVRFRSEAIRDSVFRARSQLKVHNLQNRGNAIYINEDLTAKRSELAYKTRQLKRKKTIMDGWTFAGKVLIKTNAGLIREVVSRKYLHIN